MGKKKPAPKKGKKVKPPTAAELEEQARAAKEEEMKVINTFITNTIATVVEEALTEGTEKNRNSRAVDVTAATYVYMLDRAMSTLQPRLVRDEGDGGEGEGMDDLEVEPEAGEIDRMATAVVVRKDGLSDFCRTMRMQQRGSMNDGSGKSTPSFLRRQPTKKFTMGTNLTLWGADGPAAYGFSSLSNDPRADVPRLRELFDYMDLNNSGDISLDEMQWFLEMQGQSLKRTEFQMIVEELGITGANAPLTRDKFVEFLLQRLRDDPKACFEVRASEKVPPDPNRIKDAKDLKRIMKEEQERIRREEEIKSRPRKKSSWRVGHAKTSHDHGKTEFIMKSWEELERLRSSLPNYLCAQLGRVANYDPEGDARRMKEKEMDSKKKRRTTRRPGTAPAGATRDSRDPLVPEEGMGGTSAFDKFYIMNPEYQRPIDQNEALAVSGGVEIKQMIKDRPSTAKTRNGGEFPYNQERLTRQQWEHKKKPQLHDPTTKDEDDYDNDDSTFRTIEGVAETDGEKKYEDMELRRIDDESSHSFKSLKDGRRSESPKMPSPNPLTTSPVLLKRAENEVKAKVARENKVKAEIWALELKESELLKEVSTSAMKEPQLAKLPPKRMRKNRAEYKKLASPFPGRGNRPKSAIGKSNGARAALRMQRALEFEKQGLVMMRPSTASGSTSRRSGM